MPGKESAFTLRTRIALPGVYGRMDHYCWDSKRGILLVSALGNNTVEVIDQWKRVHSITGLEHPQASVYVPGVDRIVVSSQSGKLRFYDAASLSPQDIGFRSRGEQTTAATTQRPSLSMWAMGDDIKLAMIVS